jgi:thioredoxin reductase (NADPH)
VLGAGPPRASWIPESHNTPGFPHGVGGPELLKRLTDQATQFGVEIREARANTLARDEEVFEVSTSSGSLHGRSVLLATGVIDRLPSLEGLESAVRRSLVRMCPICDAYEAIGQRIAVLGVGVIDELSGEFRFSGNTVSWSAPDGTVSTFDHLYLALGCEPQSALAIGCGAQRDDEGNLIVDAHQMTSVPGLYAAGDVVRGLNQIAVAAGEAAIAATAIHKRLRADAS